MAPADDQLRHYDASLVSADHLINTKVYAPTAMTSARLATCL